MGKNSDTNDNLQDYNLNNTGILEVIDQQTSDNTKYCKNAQHLHDETETLPLRQNTRIHSSILGNKSQHLNHLLCRVTLQYYTPRLMKETTYYNENFTSNTSTDPTKTTADTIKENVDQPLFHSKQIHPLKTRPEIVQRTNHDNRHIRNRTTQTHKTQTSPT